MNPQEKAPETATPELATKETTVSVESKMPLEEPVAVLKVEPVSEPTVAPLVTTTTSAEPTNTSEQVLGEVSDYFKKMLNSLSTAFSGEQKSTLTIVLAVLLAIPALIVVSGTLRFLNSIPLMSPALELVGLSYVAWFTYRYLLFANTRQELSDKVNEFKQKILG